MLQKRYTCILLVLFSWDLGLKKPQLLTTHTVIKLVTYAITDSYAIRKTGLQKVQGCNSPSFANLVFSSSRVLYLINACQRLRKWIFKLGESRPWFWMYSNVRNSDRSSNYFIMKPTACIAPFLNYLRGTFSHGCWQLQNVIISVLLQQLFW